MSWQPIETAPKDGTPMLVYCIDVSEIWVASWTHPFGDGQNDKEWCAEMAGLTPLFRLGCVPSHWMPMPAPPGEGDTPTPPVAGTQATVSVEAYEQLRKDAAEMAQESVRRELALARLEAEVVALRSLLAEVPTDVNTDAI